MRAVAQLWPTQLMSMEIKGKVTYVDLSGGFWGIEGEDGQQYNPVGSLPRSLQKEGLSIKAKVKPAQSFSIFMWGRNVDIQNIEPI